MTTVGKPAKDVFLKTTPEKLYNRKRLGINIDEYKNHFFVALNHQDKKK
jgi:hypothetical protein